MLTTITTERLQLRELGAGDLAAYQALITDERIAQPAGLTSRLSEQQVRASLQADCQQPIHYGVTLRSSGALIGTLMGYEHGDTTGEPDPTAVELGYLLAPAYWGRGLMPEAIQGWQGHVTAELPALQTVWASCLASNPRSQRVLIKSAFKLIDDQMMVPNPRDWGLERQFLYRYQILQ